MTLSLTHSLSQAVIKWHFLILTYNDYNDYNDYKDYKDYSDYSVYND